jgi:hypothetical protein
MADGYFTQRMAAAIKLESTEGTFNQPLAADMTFPLEVEVISPELNKTEGLRDSNGKFSRGRDFTGTVTATTTAHSYLMDPVDSTSATGALEIAPLFEMDGFRQSTWDDSGTDRLSLVWDGEAGCATGSMTAVNLGCGTGTTGYGWDLRGIRSALEIMAETPGSVWNISAALTCAIEDESQSKTVVAKEYINDAATRDVELFDGTLTLGGTATPVESITISMNPQQKSKKDPSAEGGVSTNTSTDYDPLVSITVPVGVATANWWTNATTGEVISDLTYTGTHFNIIISDLSIRNHTNEDSEGEIAMTQELSFAKIEIQAK